jgi:hypothetical protein
MHAYFPLGFSVTVIVALEVEMVGKFDDDIDTKSGIIDKLNALMFMAVAVGRSMWRRPLYVYVFVLMARCSADSSTPA